MRMLLKKRANKEKEKNRDTFALLKMTFCSPYLYEFYWPRAATRAEIKIIMIQAGFPSSTQWAMI